MNHYCTLFDIRYLSRGLALYESLVNTGATFHLYIFPFCEQSQQALQSLSLEHVTLVSQSQFETPALLAVKKDRSAGEYCWTCTPAIIEHVLRNYACDSCTYLDADLYFFADPNILIEEMGEQSILITEHRYTPKYDNADLSGIYCVQFMCFKNDEAGLKVLYWWRDRCLAWCFDRVEPGLFGDQKYLDDWTSRFEGVHVLKNLGGGLAPWNIQQYELNQEGREIVGQDVNGQRFKAIFYHFHQLKFIANDKLDLGGYQLSQEVIRYIYKPYIQHLKSIESLNMYPFKSMNIHGKVAQKSSVLVAIKRWLRGNYNVFSLRRLCDG